MGFKCVLAIVGYDTRQKLRGILIFNFVGIGSPLPYSVIVPLISMHFVEFYYILRSTYPWMSSKDLVRLVELYRLYIVTKISVTKMSYITAYIFTCR